MKSVEYLLHDAGDGPHQAAVFLRQEAVSPLLLLQSLAVALPEELHILAAILRIHMIDRSCIDTHFTSTHSCPAALHWCCRVQTERERERDLLVSSPQLSLQSGGLLVDFRLVVRPAALKRRRLTSRPAHDRQSSEEI